MFAQLGDNIIFKGAVSPASKSETRAERYAELQLVGSKPSTQSLGADLTKISLEMYFHWSFCDPDFQISILDKAKDAKEPLAYVTGDGFYKGMFLVKSLVESTKNAFPDGVTLDATLSVELVEYSTPDLEKSKVVKARQDGFAIRQNNPLISRFSPTQLSEPSAMAKAMATASAALGTIRKNVHLVSKGINTVDKVFRAVGIDNAVTKKALAKIKTTINTTSGYTARFGGVVTDIDDLTAKLDTLDISTNSRNASQMSTDYDAAATSALNLNTSFADVAAFKATRSR